VSDNFIPKTAACDFRTLLISPLPPPAGGIANWSAAILQEAQKRDDVEIFHVDTAVHWRSENDLRMSRRFFGGPFQALRDVLRVISTIRNVDPHLIHLCTSGSLSTPKDILILGAAKALGVPSIAHFRMGRLPAIIKSNGFEWKLIRRAMLFADVVLLLDKKSEDAVKIALPATQTMRIPNPIDVNMVQDITSNRKENVTNNKLYKIVYAGNCIPTKGINELVSACSGIKDYEFELLLLGAVEKTFQKEMERLAANRGNSKWLRFHGPMNRYDVLSHIHDSDLFVLPSHTEGFPNVVLEAMALGKPIVATDVGAVPEMLDEMSREPCGWLVAPQNVQDLRNAILDAIMHPEKAKTFGKRAEKKVFAFYTMDKIMAQYVLLWRSMASS